MFLKKIFFIMISTTMIPYVLAEDKNQDINQMLSSLRSDPICSMANIREYVCNNVDSLTMEQRNMLITQLENVKKEHNLNRLGMYRTWCLAITSLLGLKFAFSLGRVSTAIQLQSSIKDSYYVSGLEDRALGDYIIFCLVLAVTSMMEFEYHCVMSTLSAKEDCMRNIINDTISLLKI